MEQAFDRTVMNRVTDIASKVASLSWKRLGWISGQQSDGEWTGWAFVIGQEEPFLSNEQVATLSNDELIADAFEQANGYKLNSLEHIQWKIKYLSNGRESCLEDIEELKQRIEGYDAQIADLKQQLAVKEG